MSDNTLYETDARAVARDQAASVRPATARQAQPTTSGIRLHRRRRTQDPFYIDPKIIPPGMSYEWKRESVHGKPDVEHMIELRENHWKPVPAERHPQLAMAGDTQISRGGTLLMERPKYLTDEAQMENLQEGLRPVQQMEEVMYGTKPGEMTRDHPSVRKASYVRQQFSPGEPIGEGEGGGLSSEP